MRVPVFIARPDIRAWAVTAGLAVACLCAILVMRATPARADDLQDSAQHLSDTAFAMLNSLSSDSSKAGATDVMGELASFAGDAQTVAAALGKSDRTAAAQAMASLVSDRRGVDAAVVKNPGAISSSQWDSMKVELASLERRLPPATGAAAKAVPPAEKIVPPPITETTAPPPGGEAPTVEISNRVTDDNGVHVKGYLQGFNLKSAGIYDGDTMVTPIELSPTTEGQRVNFNFTLQDVTPAQTIRVEDHVGRIASARIAGGEGAAVERSGHEKMIELGGGTPHDAGPPPVVASRGSGSTSVIPSRSPSRRHIHAHENESPLTDVQINILQVSQSLSEPNTYQVVGQISGEGVKRAGIYIDGKLVKPIPMTPGAYTSFDTSFMLLGKEPTVRAYGSGSNFVETEIDLNTGAGTVYSSNPPLTPYYPVNPYARANPYGYPPNTYGYPPNAYGTDPYGRPYGPPPYGARSPYGYPPPSKPWWQKLF